MDYDAILRNVAKHISLQEQEIGYFTSLLTHKSVARKKTVLRQGVTCQHINFVNAGILRAYFPGSDGRESTIMFAMTDWWITDMYCFVNRLPAMLTIEAVEDSEVWQLSKANLDKLYAKLPAFERFFRILLQNAYTREQLRVIQNLSLTAEQRYDSFMAKYPQVASQVTQKQIASYLGITPEFLSAIRGNKARK